MVQKTIVIFGTFDRIHKGHLKFINQAKKQGQKLVVIIACDKMVKILKGKLPRQNELKRMDLVLKVKKVDSVLLGDKQKETYTILKKINPDIIFLGYDQQDLYNSLIKKIENGDLPKTHLIFGKPYNPKSLHSSLLNKK